MKIAIFGGTGLLGSNLLKLYHSSNDVRCYSRNHSSNIINTNNIIINYDILEDEIDKEFNLWTPDIIINTVAIVNLQICEDDFNKANEINCVIAKKLALIAKKINSYFIHISTDHFFHDRKTKHNETDEVKLLNNYAKTKYKAESEVLKENANSLVVRTNIIGFRNTEKESFFEWLLNSLLNERDTFFYTNYITSPIEVNLLGKILIKCFFKNLHGVYNISSSENISKYDFALRTAEKFNLNKSLIKKSYLESNETSLSRAINLGLDVTKIEKALDIKMPDIETVLNNLYNIYRGCDIYE